MTATPTLDETDCSDVASALRKAMIKRGITQTALAHTLGVTPASVSRMLDGSGMTIKTVRRIAAAIGLKVEFMISEQ